MSTLRLHLNLLRRLVAGVMLLSGFTLSSAFTASTISAASKVVPTCSYNQLEIAVAWGPGAAAGHIGIPFIIANTSKSACSLKGYPKLAFSNDVYKGHSLKAIDGGSMVFVSVKPRLVVIRPGADGSFGLNYGDAANQEDPNGPACTVQNVYVTLPVRTYEIPRNYETTVNFNFCYTGFEVFVTSIQTGPLPKEG
jgi:hypothetical protein